METPKSNSEVLCQQTLIRIKGHAADRALERLALGDFRAYNIWDYVAHQVATYRDSESAVLILSSMLRAKNHYRRSCSLRLLRLVHHQTVPNLLCEGLLDSNMSTSCIAADSLVFINATNKALKIVDWSESSQLKDKLADKYNADIRKEIYHSVTHWLSKQTMAGIIPLEHVIGAFQRGYDPKVAFFNLVLATLNESPRITNLRDRVLEVLEQMNSIIFDSSQIKDFIKFGNVQGPQYLTRLLIFCFKKQNSYDWLVQNPSFINHLFEIDSKSATSLVGDVLLERATLSSMHAPNWLAEHGNPNVKVYFLQALREHPKDHHIVSAILRGLTKLGIREATPQVAMIMVECAQVVLTIKNLCRNVLNSW